MNEEKSNGEDDEDIDFKVYNPFKKSKWTEEEELKRKEASLPEETDSKKLTEEIQKEDLSSKADSEDEEEVEINLFNWFKKGKKEPKIKEGNIQKEEPEGKNEDEDDVDFSFFKRKKTKEEKNRNKVSEPSFSTKNEKIEKKNESKVDKEKEEEEIHFNLSNIKNAFASTGAFLKKYSIIFLILIPILFSIFFRMYPLYLPVTDDWATNAVYNNMRAGITDQINQQYPNLPDTNKNQLVTDKFNDVLSQNKAQIEQQIQQTSQYFKSVFKKSDGQPFLPDIDTYYWYNYARNYIRNGTLGDEVINGTQYISQRNGRFGREVDPLVFNSIFGAYLYKFVHIFNKNTDLMTVLFFPPVIFVALSIIPAFFIARKFGGNLAGFFAAMIFAINSALLARTSAGFSDTDFNNVFFPLMIAWMFIEALEAKSIKKSAIFTVISGIFVGIYSKAWGGWSFIFDFIILTLVLSVVYYLFRGLKNPAQKESAKANVKNLLIIALIFIFSAIFFISLMGELHGFTDSIKGAVGFAKIKEVAVSTLWPNVMTTVAEFNTTPLSDIVNQMGGKLLLFISLVGIILMIMKKDEEGNHDVKYALFLTIWFLGTLYAFTKGVRFAILMVPAFAISFGLTLGISFNYISNWITKEMHMKKTVTQILIILLFIVLLIGPLRSAHETAKQELPMMTNAWYDSLIGIKNNESNAVITSWWDFGHWFVAVAERKVTFDGADQGRRIHWVGKSLLTSSEPESVGILRMLNCGQENAFDELNKYVNDTVKSINIMNQIILLDRTNAKRVLVRTYNLKDADAESVLNLTHCSDLIQQFYITSDDMIGKAGVWSHFGSWDFKRAKMWNEVKGKTIDVGVKILKEQFNLTDTEASSIYYEIQSNDADQWVTGWYGYRSGLVGCTVKSNIVTCNDGLVVDLATMDAKLRTQQGDAVPTSIVYATKDDVVEKKFTGTVVPYSVVLVPAGKGYNSIITDPRLAASMFTRLYFFQGHGLRNFEMFSDKSSATGQRIIIWKVSFTQHNKIIMDAFKPKFVKEGDSVSVGYIGYFKNGTVFDSNIAHWKDKKIDSKSMFNDSYIYSDFVVQVGQHQVIPGFEEALKGMGVNEEREVTIPPELAYGQNTSLHPLANKTLIFKLKVLDIS